MKTKIIIFVIIICIMAFSGCYKSNEKDNLKAKGFPVLKGPYLGQKPPAMTPEIFAPGIVSSEHQEHSSLAFSPDGTEI